MAEKNASYTFFAQRIVTNGASLAPMKITKENGEVVYMWVVDEFNDDSFMNGKTVYPKETAEDVNELINGNWNKDDDEL